MSSYEFGPFLLDSKSQLWRDGKFIELGLQPAKLLSFLLERAGKLVKRSEIYEHLWDIDSDTLENTLDSHISTLRKKLGDTNRKNRLYIKTVPGRGYIFIAIAQVYPDHQGHQISPATSNPKGLKHSGQAHTVQPRDHSKAKPYDNSIFEGFASRAEQSSVEHPRTRCTDLKIPAESFGDWLSSSVTAQQLPRALLAERSLLKVGECTVLDTAVDPLGYENIVMEAQDQTEQMSAGISIADHPRWEIELRDLESKGFSGSSAQVIQFLPELTNDPARVRYQVVKYEEVRAFHEILQNDVTLSRSYRERTLRVLSSETNVPNILAIGVVAIIDSVAKKPELVLANRLGRKKGGYHDKCWAVSIGEQYMPITEMRRDRLVEADISIFRAAERGLREELLDGGSFEDLRVGVHALVLEDYIDNFFFLAIADLRPLTFHQLKKFWRKSVDSAEHYAIAALPLSKEVLLECMQEDGLPEAHWAKIQDAGLLEVRPGHEISKKMHHWQPNSHIRLAACLWYLRDELN